MFSSERQVNDRLPAARRRIMIVSGRPVPMQEAVSLLVDDGFDVFMTHQLPESAFIVQLAPDMLICDLTGDSPYVPVSASDRLLEPYGLPAKRVLFLVTEDVLAKRLEEGAADEMLLWPGSAQEVLLHARRIVQAAAVEYGSATGSSVSTNIRRFKDLLIDTGRMSVYRDNRELRLTRTEYELLLVLLNAGGSVLTREAITERIWGSALFSSSNTVDVHVKTLRKKLGDNAIFPKYVATVRGAGYRLADERPSYRADYSASFG
ncbi:response regulator transcription factor [Paenibacillus xylaniclasticus]|uniref:response regulator transcription factor n=1 Tax=Paenibacillus xylaniclasticus TaxID=588083 RepID=UPI0013E05A7F|nr:MULTISPECIES: winged-helix domain-containing protein [Paenibacillus]GFN32815.1 hypothetical protein PCURB6_30750 [Paenibacillus curdlanolyticus]